MKPAILIESILGSRGDADLAAGLHEIEHRGRVEMLVIEPADLPRRRFHAETDHGTGCFVSLPRSAQLFDGAVLHIEAHCAIVVRVGAQRWLRLRPSPEAGLELGYLAGNLHWRVRFEDGCLLVALDGPIEAYLARLKDVQQAGKVSILD
jgi:urease accessory protein